MPRKKLSSRALRQLAEELVDRIAGNDDVADDERHDFVTSLVRQWITYDGNATIFREGMRQLYLVLGRTPLGKPTIVPEPGLPGWMKTLTRDWKISPDSLSEILDELNRGQSAEVVNSDGIPLRLWVNPKERSRGVELLVKENIPPGVKRDYRKIAADLLERDLGEDLDPDELDELACSVAIQWRKYEGYASVFIDGHQQLAFQIVEGGVSGGCRVDTRRFDIDLGPCLASCGISPDVIPEVIARINLGQEVEYRDRDGVPSRLWYDPKAMRILVASQQPTRRAAVPPFGCPKCTAVLGPWQQGQRQQACPLCGQIVSLD